MIFQALFLPFLSAVVIAQGVPATTAPDSINTWLASQPEAAYPAFTGWARLPADPGAAIDPFMPARTAMNCPSPELFAISPTQETKNYEAVYYGRFNHAKLAPRSPLCRIRNHAGTHCLAPDSLHVYLMSDLYRDRCGRIYKAFWTASFPRSHENMGSLLSRGRTIYPAPGAEPGDGNFEEGGTYPAEAKDFHMLVSPTLEEIERGARSRARALQTDFILDANGLLFLRRSR